LSSPDVIQAGQVLRLVPPGPLSDKAKEAEALPMREADPLNARALREAPLVTEPKVQRLPYSEENWAMLSAGAAPMAKVIDMPQAIATPQAAAVPTPSSNQAADEEWRWPADGLLTGRFGEGGGKGINIEGEKKSPVLSAAAGKVVYSGSGLRGYGKMVIVKHPGEFLTAYAHNHAVLVKEGEWVKPGQKIAEMGDTDSDQVKLHFEVRQYGKPIDPLKILPERR
jgi:lipoprotein NlpD